MPSLVFTRLRQSQLGHNSFDKSLIYGRIFIINYELMIGTLDLKPIEIFNESCLQFGSGGGTRTPDTRIMIPLL